MYVCEFDGIDWVLDGGYHSEWKGYVKDSTTEEVIELETATDGGIVELVLSFDPSHFMGDSYYEGDEPFVPWISVKIVDDEGLYFENNADLIAETYGARISYKNIPCFYLYIRYIRLRVTFFDHNKNCGQKTAYS